jgi:hypothetical protein
MPAGTQVMYYIEAFAISGKHQVRPMPAPSGFWKFDILGTPLGTGIGSMEIIVNELFPNPSKGITCLQVFQPNPNQHMKVELKDARGRSIIQVFNGLSRFGEQRMFFNTEDLASGLYFLNISSESTSYTLKLMIR